MRVKLIGVAAVAAAMCAACSSGKKSQQTDPADVTVTVKTDSIEVGHVMNPVTMLVTGNNLVVGSSNTDTIFYAYSFPDLTYAGSGVVLGEGPKEIYSPMVICTQLSPECQIALPYGGRGGLALIDPNTLNLIDKVTFPLPKDWMFVQNSILVSPGKYFEQRGDMPLSWAMVDNNGEILWEIEPNIPADIESKVENTPVAGMILRTAVAVADARKGRIAICNRVFPRIEIYDLNGKQINSLFLELEYNMKNVCFVNMKKDTDGFYVNYQYPAGSEYASAILRFDWDGNLKKIYTVKQKIGAFAIDPHTTGRLYFFTLNDADFLYSFTL